MRHEHAPLALAQRCSGVAAPAPLFSALLNYLHNSAVAPGQDTRPRHPIRGAEWLGGEERTNYPLALSVEDFDQALGLTAQVAQPLSPERVCDFMERALEELTEALECAPRSPVHMLDVLPRAERMLLLETWNQTEAPYPSERPIHQLFEEQVRRTPAAIAVVQDDLELSYAELNRQANRLAHHLIALGVGPDARVALCVERHPRMVVGLLAILKAGGAYVPLDPSYPHQRLEELVRDAEPVLIVCDAAGREALGSEACEEIPILALDEPRPELGVGQAAGELESDPEVAGLTSAHLAYVIYTSGSTGKPKGVMVEHAQIVRLFEATHAWYRFDEQDVWCLFHSLAFDFSVWELWGALRHGGRLVIVPRDVARSAPAFHRLVCERGVTVLNQTPSALRAFLEADAQSSVRHRLRHVIFGGEALEPSILKRWYASQRDQPPQLVNMYGITETTVHVTYLALQETDCARGGSPIGRRIPDVCIYLLDGYGEPVPLGAVGELYIGGAGVARGYLNRPELTAERFVRDRFSTRPGARMYRTGDLARYLPDGNLEFLGRNDHQVKVRGYRIELGEIEARLCEHPAVLEAVVVAREDAAGDRRLVGYVTTTLAERDAPAGELVATLRRHPAHQLPEYMVPSAFVRLEALPLTPNGKLDRKSLPAPDGDSVLTRVYEAPQGKIEETLAAVWAELLGLERVGRHDHFFELGGHSLLAVRLQSRLHGAEGVELPLATLFDQPTLVAQAEAIGRILAQRGVQAVPPIARVSREGRLALSFAQQRLWFLAQLGVGATYHMPMGLRLFGALDRDALGRSLDCLVARHEALRSVFVSVEGAPEVERAPPTCGFALVEEDLEHEPEATRAAGRAVPPGGPGAVRPHARTFDPRPAHPAGAGGARLLADPAPHRLGRVVDGRVHPGARRALPRVRGRAGRSAGAA